MTLRSKTLLIIGIALIGLIGIVYFTSSKLILNSFANLEEERTSEHVARVLNVLSEDISGIDTMTNDWAAWDDTYAFIEDGNQKYIDTNPTDDSFAGLRLNVMLFINSSGDLVYGKAFDLNDEQEIPIPQSLMAELDTNSYLLSHSTPDSSIEGILSLSEGLMLIASEPILTSDGEGPIRGTLLMGRYLDDAEVAKLAEITRLSVDIRQPDESELPSNFESVYSLLLEGEEILVRPTEDGLIAGYALINDVYQKPAIILTVDMPRSIFQQGENTLHYFLYGLIGIGLVFFTIVLVLLGRLVLSPLSRLKTDVSAVAERGDPSLRMLETGKDELSKLAVDINRMLEALEQSRETLRQSERQYAALVASLTDAVLKIKESMIVWCNDKVEEIYGYKREELLGREISIIYPESANPEFLKRASNTIKREGFFSDICRVRKKNGDMVDLEYIISLIPGTNPVELVAVVRDITERKRAELERQKLEEQLNITSRLAAIGELAAGVAHELNNPLAAIQGFAQLLTVKDDLDGTTKKQVETIHKEARRAAKITQGLLSFAREHKPDKHLISVNEVVVSTLDMCAYGIKANNIDLVVELAPDLPKTMADFQQMQQVFLNIINNAEQAMMEAHGKGKLLVKTLEVDDMIRIVFTDDGPGISEQNLKKIFQPFFTTKDVGKGTGLGLSVCYGIVESHHGHIYAESKLSEGATFVVEIPMAFEDERIGEQVGAVRGN
ncbi:MAG: hypothetical protein A2Y59_04460 [Chloroflexi bacterium RBG_13_52_14]|nr:MAG: hypothetical protein A2Y59_04460 [Chloroflexi bacterium RBG_13_52_14]